MRSVLLFFALIFQVAMSSAYAQDGSFRLDLDTRQAGEATGYPLMIDLAIGEQARADPFSFCRVNDAIMVVAGTPTNPNWRIFPFDIIVTRVTETGMIANFAPDASDETKNSIIMALARSPDCSWLDQNIAAPELLLELCTFAGASTISDLVAD